MTADSLMFIAGTVAFILTVIWMRSHEIREKYALVWLIIAFCLFGIGMIPGPLFRFAEWARLSLPAAVLFIALGLIYFFAFFVTVTLSHSYRRVTRLLQEISILENRVRKLEKIFPKDTISDCSRADD